MRDHKTTRKIAIIGGGPKGLYGFERLTAWLQIHPPSERTEIHVFNRTDSFGAGENYRTGQPSYLLMNNPVGDITMWGEEPPPVVPHPRSLSEWLHDTTGLKISDNEYAARATAGRYLSHGFESIVSNLPDNVYGTYVVGEVVDINTDSGKYSLRLKANGRENHSRRTDRYDHILLATGHPKHRKTKHALLCQSFADEHEKAGFIPFVYPVQTALSDVPPDCSVGMEGIGLTFVDAVLALTEGRGGRFERDERTEKLSYTPSGGEPTVIYPFSRSGLPMFPRLSVPNGTNELVFFTRPAVQRFDPDEKLDFIQQIWPLLRQDMIYAYYRVAMRNAGYPERLSDYDDFADVERIVAEYHEKNPSQIRFDVEGFLDPLQETEFPTGATHDEYVKSLYGYYLQEARRGELRSPLAAVTAVWRKASSLFCETYSFGGLAPESQRFFDRSFRGKLTRLTFGSPVKSAEKIFALMESGFLNFDSARDPDLILDDTNGAFILQSKPDNTRYPIRYLVDARIPKVTLADDPDALYRNLLNRGLISIYENTFEKVVYQPGAVNITRQGFVIDKHGRVNRGIAVMGTPTEGITFDNDTLSRDRNNFVDGWAEFLGKEYAKSTSIQYAQ